MKLKYYLRGVGIGVIITTLIFMILLPFHKNNLSDAEIKEKAQALGMVDATRTDSDSGTLKSDMDNTTASDTDTATEQTATSGDTKADTAIDTGTDTAIDTSADTDTGVDSGTDATADQPKKETTKQVEVAVIPGDYSDDVAAKLKEAGLIDDAEAFNKYLVKHKYDSLVQPGNYVIKKGSSYKAIAKLLITKDKQ